MANERIGTTGCSDCGEDVPVKVSAKGYAYYCCDNCGVQHFTRGRQSDAALRKKMKPLDAKPEPIAKTEPAAKPKPAADPQPLKKDDDNEFGIF